MNIKDGLEKLKSDDIYSLMMFALFKIKDIPEYSAISELCFVLDKPSFLKLCEFFGGLTITIPTITEIENLVYALLLYQYVDIDGLEYDKALKNIESKTSNMKLIKSNYSKLREIMGEYSFESRK